MMPITNSLGSNYTSDFVSAALSLIATNPNPTSLIDQVSKQLTTTCKSKIIYTFKGRQALSLALTSLGISKKDKIATQAFTCYAVEQGIAQVAKLVFVDISKDSLNLDLDSIMATYDKVKFKALVVQHTLGEVVDINSIADWCKKNQVYLIEDLAHAYGLTDESGVPLGERADAVVLSFGRDKMLDSITGGAVLTKEAIQDLAAFTKPTHIEMVRLLAYPKLSSFLRERVDTPLGKISYKLARWSGLISSPITATNEAQELPIIFLPLLDLALKQLPAQLKHRQEITDIYQQTLNKALVVSKVAKQKTLLRFPVVVSNRQRLLDTLKHQGYYLQDVWYKKPVETGSLKVSSRYRSGMCPNAEKLSQTIINLPTHIHIEAERAIKICHIINQQGHACQ